MVGPRQLTRAEVAAAIAERQAQRAKAVGITQERVLAELEQLAFSNIAHYLQGDDGTVTLSPDAPANAMRALQSIKRTHRVSGRGHSREERWTVEVKLWDKPGPLKLAGQHVGLFVERHEHTGKNGKPIEVVKKVVFGGRHKKEQEK